MAVNKQKILKNATKYAKKGQYDKAIEEYQKLAQDEFGETSLNNTIGDLYVQAKQIKDAISEYEKAAAYYEEKGFLPKALAIYRKILRHDSTLPRIYEKMAQLYSDQGLIQDAISQYVFLANHYEHEGKMESALDSYRQIADLDPSNISIRERLASLYQQQGFAEKASQERVTIGERYMKRGDMINAIKNFELALKEAPSDENALKGIVSVYLAENRVDDAKKIMNQLLERNPDNISVLTTLGKISMDHGDYDQALDVFHRVAILDPAQEGINEILGRIYIQKGNYQEAFKRLKEIIGLAIEQEDHERALGILDQLQNLEPKNITIREKKAEIYQKINRDEEMKSTYREIAEIYYENGRLEESYNIYDRLFAMDPSNQTVKQRFNQISIELRGRPIEINKLIESPKFEKIITESRERKESIIDFDENSFDFSDTSSQIESLFDTSEIEKLSIPVFQPDDFKTPSAQMAEIDSDDIFSIESDVADMVTASQSAKEVIEPTEEQVREFRIEAGVFLKYGLLEKAADRLKSILVIKSDDDESLEKLVEVYEKMGQHDLMAQTIIRRSEIALNTNKNHDMAISLLNDALNILPSHPLIIRKLEEFGVRPIQKAFQSESAPATKIKPPRQTSDFEPLIPLSDEEMAKLSGGSDAEAYIDIMLEDESSHREGRVEGESILSDDLAQVVREFREELVSKPQTQDVETHLNLGIAYKEMGLLDEAIAEFKLAMDFPEKLAEASHLLSLCYMEQEEPEKAVNVLNKALKYHELSVNETLSLKYNLALAKKSIGDIPDALMLLKEIQQQDKNYRDTSKLLKEIKKSLD